MVVNPDEILGVLDRCCETFRFPMLDNGYIYLAATRLSLYRSRADWAMVIEVFGFSPRAGAPDTCIQTFASQLHDRHPPDRYVNRQAYHQYLANNPNNEFRSIFPVQAGPWQDAENEELVAHNATEVVVREKVLPLPPLQKYARHGIDLQDAPQVRVYEICRFLADIERERILATPEERRASVLPAMQQILQLEEWHHPNVVDENDRPSKCETFRQLAEVLATGDTRLYRPSRASNTHWRNWPEGGRL